MDMPDFTREEVIAKVAAGESLEQADLVGIDLRGANLTGADLQGADLQGADLPVPGGQDSPRADLRETNLRFARYNGDTKFPGDFDPEAAGMVNNDDPLAVGV